MATETVRGRKVVIHFDGARCIHSRNCVLGHPDVFVPNVEGEWIRQGQAWIVEGLGERERVQPRPERQ